MFGVINWNDIGVVAAVMSAAVVVGTTVSKTVRDRMTKARDSGRRLDQLEIRLFGLPPDPATGAKKLDGEFDRIDNRLEALPGQIIAELRKNGG